MSKRGDRAASAAKKHPVLTAIICVILVIIIAVAAIIWFVRPDIYHKFIGTGEHTYGEWEITTPNSCGQNGERRRVCSVCGEVKTEIIPATHNHAYGEWQTVEENDCGNDGKRERKCPDCNDVQTEILEATQEHSYGEWQTVKENNCGQNGRKERVCSVCGDVNAEVIPATGEHSFDPESEVCTICGYDPNASNVGVAEEIPQAELSIHFLELGNKYTGDCTLIKCGNTEVLIDAGSRQNSAVTIKNYVDNYCTDGVLEYVIATHAHQDHIAGFVGNKSGSTRTGILYQYEVGTLIQFAGHNATTQIYNNYVQAVEYVKDNGTNVFTAKECWYQTGGAKKTYYLDEAQTISLNILYQRYYEESTSDENDYSVCVLLTQKTENGDINYLFTGDLEKEGEASLVKNNKLPQVELFKGGHHGSYTASTDALLSVIKPKNVAVCCCCGTTEYTSNKDNTFPAQAFIDRVAKYTENVYCTTLMTDYKNGKFESMNGNIVFYYKKQGTGGSLKLWCSNNTDILKDTEWFQSNRTWKST
ncbi:MAG: MBL fold metallo-hydrolase [Muribaculaceae bacterium]|nr:MBL fold metallo-hydrolase [Muribaculaceae bacterium]